MGQTVDKIEEQIQDGRENLRSNLDELGQRVKSVVDWRAKFRAYPVAALAIAFGGGFILAGMARGSRKSQPPVRGLGSSSWNRGADESRGQALRAWDEIQSALVGVVARKVAKTLANPVPRFKEQTSSHGITPSARNGVAGTH